MSMSSIELVVSHVSVCKQVERGRYARILNDVSFSVKPGTLTAIIGPNGAGKTTLMKALSGERPNEGKVLINGEDMYADPEYWLKRIGYVPVDNVLHEQLSIEDSLLYLGRLRLPNTSIEEVRAKVNRLLVEFDFGEGDERRQRLIRKLSSGERKRANVCAELLTDPPLLLLDEPTSNLDPDAERNLMHNLASYARRNGQTILVITHTLNTIDVCDEVIFIENSRLRAAGAREEVLQTLEKDWNTAEANPSYFYRWAQIFDHYKTRNERETCIEDAKTSETVSRNSQSHPATDVLWFSQLRYLLSRYLKIRLGDKWSLAGTLLIGLCGILFFILPADTFIKPKDAGAYALGLNQARQSIFIVSLVVTLIGLITSYTEISKEFRIYRHERLKGLSPSAYFLSKWLWLVGGVGVLAPCLLLGFIVLVYMQPLPGFPKPRINEVVDWWEQFWRFQLTGLFTTQIVWYVLTTLILACITSLTVGMLISALAADSDKGYLYLSFVVVFVVLFSGLIRNERLEKLIDYLSFLSTGRWAFEGFASNLSLYCWTDGWRFNEFNSTGHVLSIWFALGIFTLIASLLTLIVLQLRDPWYPGWVNLQRFVATNRSRIAIYLSISLILFSFAVFLQQQSYEYHMLNYWSRKEYGGTGGFVFANIQHVEQPLDSLQMWNGKISQSWCSEKSR